MRKVYTILATMIAVTCLGAWGLNQEPLRMWVYENAWVMTLNLILTLVLLLACVWKRHHHPVNLVLLGLFTVSQAVTVGAVGMCHLVFLESTL